MIGFFGRKKEQKIQESLQKTLPHEEMGEVPESYRETLAHLKNVFRDDDPMEFRELSVGRQKPMRVCLVFCDGLSDASLIDNFLIRPLMGMDESRMGKLTADMLLSGVLQINSGKKTRDWDEIVENITYGNTLLLAEGIGECLLFDTKNFPARSVSEPEGEKILSGPREGFTEVMMTNLAMVRRKLRTGKLKMRYYTLGKQTNTKLCIAWLDGIADSEIIRELYRRLDSIDIDGILDANYVNELIRDNPWSPFRSTGYTERPDVVVAKLLEGRIAIFVDGTPVVLTLPYLFIENFQSNEDYYLNYYYTSFARILRIAAFFLTVAVPGLYIAVVGFHQEMLPTPLLISLAVERQKAPLPAAFEALVMLLAFDILRETGIRMPSNVGQALSIVGALVIGQAAVEASLVAAPMIIVVAATGITSLLVPKLNAPIIYWRILLLVLSSAFGFFGLSVGLALLLIHINNLSSFGVEQISLKGSFKFQDSKDIFIRASWRIMRNRPERLSRNKVRQTGGNANG